MVDIYLRTFRRWLIIKWKLVVYQEQVSTVFSNKQWQRCGHNRMKSYKCGICDITLRDMHTKITALRTTSQDETINKLQNLIHGGIAEISKISNAKVRRGSKGGGRRGAPPPFPLIKLDADPPSKASRCAPPFPQILDPRLKVVVLPVAGIDLNRYNHKTGTSEDQRILNFIITAANKLITDINNERGIATPGAVGLIHRCKGRGRWSHRYKYLTDGCHFGKLAISYFATQLAKSIGNLS